MSKHSNGATLHRRPASRSLEQALEARLQQEAAETGAQNPLFPSPVPNNQTETSHEVTSEPVQSITATVTVASRATGDESGTTASGTTELVRVPYRGPEQPADMEQPVAMGPVVEEVRYVNPWKVRLSTVGFRQTFDDETWEAIRDLAATMKMHGPVTPSIVRPIKWQRENDEEWEVVTDDIPVLAAREANVLLPVIERKMDDLQSAFANLITTFHNPEVSAMDKGVGLDKLQKMMQEQLDKWLKIAEQQQRQLGGGPKNKIVSSAAWAQVQREFVNVPTWMVDIIERSGQTRKPPKVTIDDMVVLSGLQRRQIYYLMSIANLTEDIDPEIVNALSGQQTRLLSKIDDPIKRRKLAKEMVNKGLKGKSAADRFRQLTGKILGNGAANESGGGKTTETPRDDVQATQTALSTLALTVNNLREDNSKGWAMGESTREALLANAANLRAQAAALEEVVNAAPRALSEEE
jgi:hypothetical protein